MWYRIDDETAGIAVLLEADNAEDATKKYLEEYGPDLYVAPASDGDIEEWKQNSDDEVWSI